MTTYFREFSDGISDWTQRPALSGNDAPTWAVQNTVEVSSTSASNHYEALAWDDIDADGNRATVELYGMQKIPANSTTNRVCVVRMSTDASARHYSVRLRPADVALYRGVGTTQTQVAAQSITGGTAGEWWHYRLRANGDSFKIRVWEDGGSEPGTWDIETTDSTYSTAGYVGLFKGANTNEHVWKKFGVGTNGDTAPTSGYSAVTFSGTVPTLNGQRKAAFSESVAAYFSGTETPFAYSVQSGSLPAGLSLNSSTGVISGTPTATGTASGLVIRATDVDSNTADTNSFSIAIAAATVPDLADVAITSIDADGGVISVDVVF